MSCNLARLLTAALAVVFLSSPSHALPYSQDFSSGAASWQYSSQAANTPPLVANVVGGPDNGPYVSISRDLAVLTASSTQVMFRAHSVFSGIDLGYTGNWVTGGIKEVSAFVRHNAPTPLPFFTRIAPDAAFPGAFLQSLTDVPANVWTKVTFNVAPGSPQIQFVEGGVHNDIFTSVANLQFGPVLGASLPRTGTFTFDLDKVNVSLVPEPGTGILATLGIAALGMLRRRREAIN